MDGKGFVDAEAVREKGTELHETYASGNPFPHIAIDDFLPQEVIDLCLAEFDRSRHDGQTVYNREQERLKREFKPDELSPEARALFYSFNSRPFIRVIENITGIKGLIPDPYFMGGGFHEISNGGHLSVHADFNHHKPMNVERRVNVLIYLNADWKPEYGGQLELWDNDMKGCVQSIVPMLNRCVMFNTTSFSNHGNPQSVNHPAGVTRKSIALYYYTATWDGAKREHTTQFRARPGTVDKVDWAVRRSELLDDFLPPILRRGIAKVRGRGRAPVEPAE
jgi:hypothetical protein